MATDTIADTTPASTSVSDALDALITEEGGTPVVNSDPTPEPAAEPEQPAEDTELDPEPAATDSDDLAALAEEAESYYGMSKEEVERAGDLLPWVMARMDRQASLLMQGQAEPNTAEHEPEPVAPREPEKKREPISEIEAFDLPIVREDYDEGQLKVFDTLKDEINKQRSTINEHRQAMQMMAQLVRDTHQNAAELREKTDSATTTEFANSMDEFFSKLPDEYADLYGRDPMSRLAMNSPHVAARHALVREMKILEDFDKKGGRGVRATKEQATRTLRALHADKAHAVARREVDKQLKTRRQNGIARPSGRSNAKSDDLASRRTRAMSAMDKYLPALGL